MTTEIKNPTVEETDEFYRTVANLPVDTFADKIFWNFARKAPVRFPYHNPRFESIGIKTHQPFGVICEECSVETTTLFKMTIDEYSNSLCIQFGAYCQDCNRWTMTMFRYYPEGHRFLVFKGNQWIEMHPYCNSWLGWAWAWLRYFISFLSFGMIK